MTQSLKKRLVLPAALLICFIANACNTPVFRYALERWEPDPYTLFFFTNGPLTPEQQQVAESLLPYQKLGYRNPPFYLESEDVSAVSNRAAEIWSTVSSNRPAPCVALVAPPQIGTGAIWTDELSREAADRIVNSPARAEIAKRLLGGDAAVWLLIPGKDPAEAGAARELLARLLPELEKTEFNPDFLAQVQAAGHTPPELRFSLLEIDRSDPDEAVLLSMIPDLTDEEQKATLVIPVFGQGRAVVIISGQYIAEQYLTQVAEFLTGSCSCEVKSMNPGFDLLIPVDWISGITAEYVYDSMMPPLVSFAEMTPPAPEPAPATEPAPAEQEITVPADEQLNELKNEQNRLLGGVLGVFMIVTFSALGFTTWLLIRKTSRHESV